MNDIDRSIIVDDLVKGLAAKGLVVMPAVLVDDAVRLQKARVSVMRRSKVTAYEVVKFQLLPNVSSLNTVKNMVKDGRILAGENYRDSNGKLYITKIAIERLNSGAL
jgi:hypothetical protein